MSSPVEIRARIGFTGVGRAAFHLDVDLKLPAGITAVLGPSGSGKTTLLSLIAGRLRPTAGRIALGDRVFFDDKAHRWMAPHRRRVGYVFQEYRLFPHLTALENAAFGVRGVGATEAARRAASWLERLGIAPLSARHPGTLSGGEQQRVALARALAAAPDLLLLDEPAGALDRGTRAELLDAERAAHEEAGVPFLHVCHSPAEAARIGDHAIVLSAGKVVQEGTPIEVLNTPASLAVARVAGFENILPARVIGHREAEGITEVDVAGTLLAMGYCDLPVGSPVDLALRAEDILLAREAIRGTSARNVIHGTVTQVRLEQGSASVEVEIPTPVRVAVTPLTVRELGLEPGASVHLLIKARALHRLE